MEKASSADGTTIAYDAQGTGPLVVIVGGAFNDRNTWAELAGALAEEGFTAVSYDRRGRGDSEDTQPYAVEREIEDLGAVISAAGGEGPVYAHAVSSGAALVFRATAAGVPLARISVLEPPYRGAGAPPPPDDYIATLQRYVDADDRDGLVEYFQTQVIGLPTSWCSRSAARPCGRRCARSRPRSSTTDSSSAATTSRSRWTCWRWCRPRC